MAGHASIDEVREDAALRLAHYVSGLLETDLINPRGPCAIALRARANAVLTSYGLAPASINLSDLDQVGEAVR